MTTQAEQEFSLRSARVNSGHSVRSLAQLLKIDQRTLARLEEGLPVYPQKAKIVADYFEVQVTDLMPADSGKATA